MTGAAHLRGGKTSPRAACRVRGACRWFALPVTFYFVVFSAMTYPAILSFSSHFFCDGSDGLQNVWDIWWVHKAIVDLNQLPWHTTWLDYPAGTTLLGQTLHPFNGLIGIPLSVALSPVQVHNVAVLVGFVGGGWTAFLLAHEATRAYLPSLLGGLAFTFSGYHFAHAEGHLQLVSLQWVPLFVLCWLRLLRSPSVTRGLGAAAALGLVILCDYYYFVYCVGIGALALAFHLRQRRDIWLIFRRRLRLPMGAFVAASLSTSGLLAAALLWKSAVDPFTGYPHDPSVYSTDLLAPFVPGGHSAYGHLTSWYWKDSRGYIHESSVYLGLVALALATWGVIHRRSTRLRAPALWLTLGVGAFVLSLGPSLTYRGESLTRSWMPYRWLEAIVPPLRMSGCPARMMVIVALSLSVLVAAGFAAVLGVPSAGRRAATAFLALAMVADLWPRALTLTRPEVPEWVRYLTELPEPGAMLDITGTDPALALYYQTIHERPMAFGYTSRPPRSVLAAREQLLDDLENGRLLRIRDELGFRYLVIRALDMPASGVVYEGLGVRVIDMGRLQLLGANTSSDGRSRASGRFDRLYAQPVRRSARPRRP